MKVEINKKPKSTLELVVTVPNTNVKETYELILDESVKQAEIPGFRKGAAPKDIVKEKTDVSKLYGEVINKLLQTYYPQALKEHHITPIANPKVEIKEFDLEKDFIFHALVPTEPEITIGDYKKKIKDNFKQKSEQLKKDNAERLKKGEKLETDHLHLSPENVIDGIIESTKIEIADIVIEDETDRMLSRLINQAQAIGLSLDQYLKTQNKSADDLRKEYIGIATKNLTAEFALSKLIKDEKIEITDEEIKNTISASGDEQAIKALDNPSDKLYVKSILLKNKLVTNILSELEEPHEHATDGKIKDAKK